LKTAVQSAVRASACEGAGAVAASCRWRSLYQSRKASAGCRFAWHVSSGWRRASTHPTALTRCRCQSPSAVGAAERRILQPADNGRPQIGTSQNQWPDLLDPAIPKRVVR